MFFQHFNLFCSVICLKRMIHVVQELLFAMSTKNTATQGAGLVPIDEYFAVS